MAVLLWSFADVRNHCISEGRNGGRDEKDEKDDEEGEDGKEGEHEEDGEGHKNVESCID